MVSFSSNEIIAVHEYIERFFFYSDQRKHPEGWTLFIISWHNHNDYSMIIYKVGIQ